MAREKLSRHCQLCWRRWEAHTTQNKAMDGNHRPIPVFKQPNFAKPPGGPQQVCGTMCQFRNSHNAGNAHTGVSPEGHDGQTSSESRNRSVPAGWGSPVRRSQKTAQKSAMSAASLSATIHRTFLNQMRQHSAIGNARKRPNPGANARSTPATDRRICTADWDST